MSEDRTSNRFNGAARPAITVDVERYQSFLDGTDMTQAQKEAYLQDMWEVMVGFVKLGFDIHPAQLACGQNQENSDPGPLGKLGRVYSEKSKISETFNSAPEVD
ncbi:hypothetical protein [Roseibium algae]|uniref:Uncharacterized protein n=1 Tax=Roseibium algae TaxID=3123038 RepID=A0ABU8TGK4_9HYPH